MARIFDIIEWADPNRQDLVHRVPERGSGDFRTGSQLIVRESQAAVFYRDGKALDTFEAGRHTITTANIPLLTGLIGLAFKGDTPFKAEVYFVNTGDFLDQKWGTQTPISLRDSEIGRVRLVARGTYSIYISDPQTFVVRIVAGRGYYSTRDITNYLRSIIILKLTDLLGETMKTKSMFDLPPLMEEISAATRAKIREDFEALGITIKGFYVEAISPTEKTAEAIDAAAAIGAIGNMQSFVQYKAAEAMTTAAAQGGTAGGLAGAGVGLGAGVGMGAAMAQTIASAMQPQTQPQTQQVAKEATVSCPSCSTANPVGATFCNNCGTKLGGGVTCPKCAAENAPGAKFCNNCGQGLG